MGKLELKPHEPRGMWIDGTAINLGVLDAKILALTLPVGRLRNILAHALHTDDNTQSVSVTHDHAGPLKAHYDEVAVNLMARGVDPHLHLGYVATLTGLMQANGELP